MSDALMTAAEAAAALGLTPGSFSNNVTKWQLRPVGNRGRLLLYRAADIEGIRLKRVEAQTARRTPAPRKPLTLEQANARMERDLATDRDRNALASDNWGRGKQNTELTPRMKAVIYDAWEAGTLGPGSPYLAAAELPPSFRLASERFREPVAA